MKMENFLRMYFIRSLLSLFVLTSVSADGTESLFNAPTTSSTYARVQYANQANLTRRFGIHRDPTIQYISFDDLYNKYNRPKNGPVAADDRKDVQTTTTTEAPSMHADDKMDVDWSEGAPDLRNGWTVERMPQGGSSSSGSAVTPSKTRVKGPSTFDKGIDQVYAYSNAYQSGQFGKDRGAGNPTKTGFVQVAPSEYAHAAHDDGHQDQDQFGMASDLKANTVVMEASWTDAEEPEDALDGEDRIDSDVETTTRPSSTVAFSAPADGKAGGKMDGVQSAWRPFAGPTIPPARPVKKRVTKTTPLPKATTPANASEDDTLFYDEAQKAALEAALRRPSVSSKGQIPTGPVAPGRFPPQQVFDNIPAHVKGATWPMPNVVENEVTRPAPMGPKFPLQSNQHQIVLPPPPSMFANGGQQPNGQIQLHLPPNGQFQQGQPPNGQFQQGQPPNGQFQRPQPPNGQFQQMAPPNGQFGPPSGANPRFPLSRPPTGGGLPSGPVGLPPQLLNPNGQGRPRPGESQMQIPLPVPRPSGPLGTSPNNPLPGPPISLPGIPAFNMFNGEQPARPNVNRNDRNGPNTPPGFSSGPPPNFQTVSFPDRSDGPQQQPPNNFVRGPPQRPPPPFGLNFLRSPPPPPPPKATTSATSIIKSFFSRLFPFARSLDLDGEGVPIIDVNQLTSNGTNLTSLENAPPEVLVHLFGLNATNVTDVREGLHLDSVNGTALDQ